MKTKRLFSALLCVLFVFCSVFTTSSIFNIRANAQTEDNSSIQSVRTDTLYCSSADDVYVSLETDKTHFSNDENIMVSYYVNSEDSIINVNYSQNGFSVSSITTDIDAPNRVIAVLSCDPNAETHSISIQIVLSSDKTLTAMLYAITNEYGTFISPFSEDDARQRYFDYANANNLMTQDEYETIKAELSKIDVVEDETIERPSLNSGGITIMATSSNETYVKGTLQWTDDAGNNHPLRRVMIRIYDKEPIGSTHIATTYADNDGNYSYTFDNPDGFWDFENGGNDIFIRVYAGTNNAMVQNSSGEDYYYESSVSENVTTGTTVTKNLTIGMSTDKGRAFQISQAILTARDYAWNMMDEMPEDVTIRYPYDSGCYYESWESRITITGNARNSTTVPNSYASWDVIMHEYGHHISYQLGIIDSPGGSHTFNSNLSDARNNKDDGIRLAWSEAWPTVFAMQAQNYWSSYLQNIDAINDTTYDAYNFWNPYEIENNTDYLGDGCEVSIIAVLWDLFDSANETNDTLSLGHTKYWAVTTGNQSKTFSNFIGYFYEQYPSYIDDIGLNLSYYEMATTKPYISNSSSVSQTVPPTFKWSAQGGSSTFPNNSFVLIFYNSAGAEILRTATTTSLTYTLTQSEWNSILYSDGKTYTMAVAATQTTSPATGEYISAKSVVYTKPTPTNLTQTINIPASNRYTEKIVNLQPGQYIEYKVTFATSGTKLIQSFGNKDARIYVYNSSGTLLTSDDDSGYSLNALLSYYFSKNVEYTIKVQFYNSNVSGQIKLAITPAYGVYNSEASSITRYEDIHTVEGCTGYTWNTYAQPNYTRVITFKAPTSGNYKIEIESEFDTYVYVIDPRSNSAIVYNVNYNDDSGEGMNPLLTTYLEANIPYLIIYSAYNPSSLAETTDLTLHITKS